MPRGFEHEDEIVFGAGRLAQHRAETVFVVPPARDALEHGDHLVAELPDDVVAHRAGDRAVRLVRHVEHRDRAVVLLPQDLEPLHEREAPRVRQEQEARIGDELARGPDVPRFHHAEIALDVGADVLGMAELLGDGDVLSRLPAHRGLQGVDLGEDREEVERAQQLGEVAGDERVDVLLAGFGAAGEAGVVLGHHPLLPHLAVVLPGGGGSPFGSFGRHGYAWLQS